MARILILSQAFYPDSTAVSQVLADLAEDLYRKGHDVEVLSSRRAYENPGVSYPPLESYRGVTIRRFRQAGFSKKNPIGRAANFASFNAAVLPWLLLIRKGRYDAMIGTTSPPLLSYVGLMAARFKRIPFCFYAMDLQPELAIVSGYLRRDNLSTRLFMKMSDYAYRKSNLVVTLDRFMATHIVRRGAQPNKIKIIPIWPVMSEVYNGSRQANPFRREMGFGDKIVIMYSGNMAVVHPLDTLLEAAVALRNDERFLYVFIGGGVRKKDVEAFKMEHRLANIVLLPLQPREVAHISLGSADLQAVIHGNACTGYTHPSKVYGAMFIGKPILYIGPEPSHISDILEQCHGNIAVKHGASQELAEKLKIFASSGEEEWKRVGERNKEYVHQQFSRSFLVGRLTKEIESIIP